MGERLRTVPASDQRDPPRLQPASLLGCDHGGYRYVPARDGAGEQSETDDRGGCGMYVSANFKKLVPGFVTVDFCNQILIVQNFSDYVASSCSGGSVEERAEVLGRVVHLA